MISVIVPFYQTEENLFDACIKSILFNADADIELIIVDDGSANEYRSFCDKFLIDKRVKVFHIQHKGVSFARNYGIDNTKGEWVIFVDSDDKLESDWYERLVDFLYDNSQDIICFNGFKDVAGKLSKNIFFIKENQDYGKIPQLKYQVMESALSMGYFPRGFKNYYSLGSPCSKLYRSDFLKSNNLKFDTEISFAEDTFFALNVYQKASHIIYVNLFLYHYVFNKKSSTERYRPGLSLEMNTFFSKVKQFLDDHCLNSQLANSYYSRAFSEILRAMQYEFYNCDNPSLKSEIDKEFNKFISKEPYKKALRVAINGQFGIKRQLIAFLIEKKMYSLVNRLRLMNKRVKC